MTVSMENLINRPMLHSEKTLYIKRYKTQADVARYKCDGRLAYYHVRYDEIVMGIPDIQR